MITYKSKEDFLNMSIAGKVVKSIHEEIRNNAIEGVTLKELDLIAKKIIEISKCKSNFYEYRGYPAYICASPNDVVVHGIPTDYRLKDGDILSIDVGAVYNGLHADAATTYGIGNVSNDAIKLMETTESALLGAIDLVQDGQALGTIGEKINFIGEENSYGVVKEYIGHGIGFEMHEEPNVLNYGEKGKGIKLKKGMAICIEPMFNIGSPETYVEKDDWTVKTKDGSLSAHFEHTIGLTPDGVVVFT